MLVKLQRPPPEMRIFLPMRSACSRTATRRPRLPASMAHNRPAAPPPITRTSNFCAKMLLERCLDYAEGESTSDESSHAGNSRDAGGGLRWLRWAEICIILGKLERCK